MSTIQHITFDSTNESHVAWFDAVVARTTDDKHSGTGALSWTANALFSGVNLSNYPYFPGIVAGLSYDFDLWIKGASGAYDTSVDWTIYFGDEAGQTVGSSTSITVPVTGQWAKSTRTRIVAPTGATRVSWSFSTNNAGVGSVILIDDIVVQDRSGSFHWVSNESGLLLPASPLGWWDGSAIQPMTQESP